MAESHNIFVFNNQGKAGKPGEKGARGVQGQRGLEGQKGAEGSRGKSTCRMERDQQLRPFLTDRFRKNTIILLILQLTRAALAINNHIKGQLGNTFGLLKYIFTQTERK